MNAGLVVGIPWGGGDTQTLPYAKELCLNFMHSQVTGVQKLQVQVIIPLLASENIEPPGGISTT